MKNRFLDQEYLDGLFKYHNKNYGAYQIHKTYERRMLWSFVFVISASLCFIFGYSFFQYLEESSIFDNSYIATPVILADYQQLLAPIKTVKTNKSSRMVITNVDEEKEKNDSIKIKKQEQIKKDSLALIDSMNTAAAEQLALLKKDSIKNSTPVTLQIRVDKLPEFPGGDSALKQFLFKNLIYPESTKKQMIMGLVKVGFIVEKDGSISNIKIVKSIHPLLDNEVLRVIKNMTAWKPSYKNGKPIRFYCTIPVSFEPIVVRTN